MIDFDFDLSEHKKSGTDFLYFDNFYSLIVAVAISFSCHYICQSSEIYSSNSPSYAFKIVHKTTLRR